MVKKVWVEEGKTLICLIGQSLNLASLSVGLLEAEEDLVAVWEEEAEAHPPPHPPQGSFGGGGAVLTRQGMEGFLREE